MEDPGGVAGSHHHTDDVEPDIGVKVERFHVCGRGAHQFAAFRRSNGLFGVAMTVRSPGLHLHHYHFVPLPGHDIQLGMAMPPVAVKEGVPPVEEPLARELFPAGTQIQMIPHGK